MIGVSVQSGARVHLIHLTRGDDVLKCIEQEIERTGMRMGVVTSGIGSLSSARYHYIGSTADVPEDVFETVEAPLELVSIQGLILEGRPHLHALFSRFGKDSFSGHLEEGCVVLYLAEISIMELEGPQVIRQRGAHGIVTSIAIEES